MRTLAEIEKAVAELQSGKFAELLRRMQERDGERWDREMEEDARSGRLEALHRKLAAEEADEAEGRLF